MEGLFLRVFRTTQESRPFGTGVALRPGLEGSWLRHLSPQSSTQGEENSLFYNLTPLRQTPGEIGELCQAFHGKDASMWRNGSV